MVSWFLLSLSNESRKVLHHRIQHTLGEVVDALKAIFNNLKLVEKTIDNVEKFLLS